MDNFKVSHFGGWGNAESNDKILWDTVQSTMAPDGTFKYRESIGWGATQIKYQRVFWLFWKVIEGPDDEAPRHCIRIFRSKWCLQIRRWKPYGCIFLSGKDSPDIPNA